MDSAPAGTLAEEGITPAELRLAARNHGMPLEALRYPITPAGLYYLLIHYDIPAVDPSGWRLGVQTEFRQALLLDGARYCGANFKPSMQPWRPRSAAADPPPVRFAQYLPTALATASLFCFALYSCARSISRLDAQSV